MNCGTYWRCVPNEYDKQHFIEVEKIQELDESELGDPIHAKEKDFTGWLKEHKKL